MARGKANKLLEFLVLMLFGSAIFLIALYVFYSPCADYQPRELVLNCFKAREIWAPFCTSPDGRQLVAAGFGRFYWIDNWAEKKSATETARELEICPIQDIAFSGNGSRLGIYAGGRKADEISVFDADSRQLVNSWRLPPCEHGHELVLSHDGSLLVTECADRVEVWKSSTGELVNSIPTPENSYPASFCFSKGRLLIAYYEEDYKRISIYGLDEPCKHPKLVSSMKTSGRDIFNGVAMSADGSLLGVNLGIRAISVYQTCDGKLVAEFKNAGGITSSNHFEGFVLSADGSFLASSNPGYPDDDTVTVWAVRSRKLLCTFRGFHSTPDYLAFGPGGKTLVTADGHAVAVWDISGFGRDGN
jgi:hypothetical protein